MMCSNGTCQNACTQLVYRKRNSEDHINGDSYGDGGGGCGGGKVERESVCERAPREEIN